MGCFLGGWGGGGEGLLGRAMASFVQLEDMSGEELI